MRQTNNDSLEIIVAEDDEEIRELLVHFLETAGHKVRHENLGAAAVQQAKKLHADMIFTDWDIGDMTGTEVAKAIRKFDQQVIIVMMTGWNIDTLLSETPKGLVDKIIKKPFDLKTILETIAWGREVLGNRLKE